MAFESTVPLPRFDNYFLEDATGALLFEHWAGRERFARVRPHFETLGRAAALHENVAATAERNAPRLVSHAPNGERIDAVDYHPAYRALERASYGNGIVGVKFESPLADELKAIRHLTGFGAGYYFAQCEPGIFCPICMTDGVGRVLERHNDGSDVVRETLRRVASRDPETWWRGAMFLTEKQGGSDVGANAVEARREGSSWRLYGEKWFCSNVDAEAALVLARMPSGAPGTRGLGLFLMLRQMPVGNDRAIRIDRLKDKFGTRSMPTGEVALQGAEAFLIGGENEGFKQMAEMLNLSRLYNSVASIALMRRGLVYALAYGAERRAFGAPLWRHPLWRATMADVSAEALGAFLLVFETVRALDAADCGDVEAQKLVRAMTPVAKAVTAKLAVWAASESIEAVGGNGYVEEMPLARNLREAQVLPIWEGTTNILSLDLLRALQKEAAHEAIVSHVNRSLAQAGETEIAGQLAARRDAWLRDLTAASRLDATNQQRFARGFVEKTSRLLTLSVVCGLSGVPSIAGTMKVLAARLSARTHTTAPAGAFEVSEAEEAEETLLRAQFAGH